MKTWRMAFRVGNQGTSLWPECRKLGVAAITYYPVIGIDFSKYDLNHLPKKWNELSPTQKKSLLRVAYEMEAGDEIFVKEGKKIVSRGKVVSAYIYDYKKRIIDENGTAWPHQLRMDWDETFTEVEVLLGAEQFTVLELDSSKIKVLRKAQDVQIRKDYEKDIFVEGERFRGEQEFRIRNRLLIQQKKDSSDLTCEVCGFNFEAQYGEIGKGFVEAHHLTMISAGERENTIDDIALVCSNCHSMIHRRTPPLSIREMKKKIKCGNT